MPKKEKITVLGTTFTVERTKLEGDDLGDMSINERKIRIDHSASYGRTLLHEVIHAAIGLTGWSEVLGRKEEGIVLALESALKGVVSINTDDGDQHETEDEDDSSD